MTHHPHAKSPYGPAATTANDGNRRRQFTCKGGLLLSIIMLGLLALPFVSGCVGAAVSENDAAGGSAEETVATPSSAGEADPVADDAGSSGAEPIWQDDFQDALTLASEKKLPVLLRFSATWCMPCRVMDTSVWPDEQVKAALAAHAIPVKIDVDQQQNRDIVQRYGIRGIPALVLVDAQGDELARGGFMGTEALVEFLRAK